MTPDAPWPAPAPTWLRDLLDDYTEAWRTTRARPPGHRRPTMCTAPITIRRQKRSRPWS